MRIAKLTLLAFAGVLLAQEPPSRRIGTVRYNVPSSRLCWDIEIGKWSGEGKKDFRLERLDEEACIDLDDASMTVEQATRWFSKEEAENILRLVNALARYSAESTIWWEQGKGFKNRKERDKEPKKQEPHKEVARR